MRKTRKPHKPPYRVPSMDEVARVRGTNGYKVVSTFSGCGGSCLGFEMAGFEIAWASEFIPVAREVYELNHPGVYVDARDIREVRARDVLSAVGLSRGEVDVLEGSPPCTSFSMAGKRSRKWGKVSRYSETKQRTDDLFFEFARLLDGIQPRTFVAENVSGMVRGVAKGYFKEILARLKACGYRVLARLLDAQWLGVPQHRQRIIFVGVCDDLDAEPRHPEPLPYRYTVAEACPWIVRQAWSKGQFSKDKGERVGKMRDTRKNPSPTIGAGPSSGDGLFPPSRVEAVSIEGYEIGKEAAKLGPGEQSRRYFNLVRAPLDAPCPTITQVGGVASIASVVHPTEMRKLSIEELKRICAFPDDFLLTGSYAQQWERLGRAVPPIMMRAVARVVRDVLLELDGRTYDEEEWRVAGAKAPRRTRRRTRRSRA